MLNNVEFVGVEAMSRTRSVIFRFSLIAGFLACFLLVISCGEPTLKPPPSGKPPAPVEISEGLAHWYVKLAKNRYTQLDRLHGYAVKGEFPKNPIIPTETPFFVDATGTSCAVAFLMIQDGLREAVRQISQTNNHVFVSDVTEGPLIDWIATSGLTQKECAAIQPMYGWQTPEIANEAERERRRIREHLLAVEGRLRGQTHESLQIALTALLPTIRTQFPATSIGFLVGNRLRQAPTPIVNKVLEPLRIRVVYLDARGEAWGPDHYFQNITLAAGEEHSLNFQLRYTWLFIEWEADATIEGEPIEIKSG